MIDFSRCQCAMWMDGRIQTLSACEHIGAVEQAKSEVFHTSSFCNGSLFLRVINFFRALENPRIWMANHRVAKKCFQFGKQIILKL